MLWVQISVWIFVVTVVFLRGCNRKANKIYRQLNKVSKRKGKGWKQDYIGHVYFTSHADKWHKVKIGKARVVKNRMADFKTFAPDGIIVFGSVRCKNMKLTEDFLHEQFKDMRVNREWFYVSFVMLFLIVKISRDSERFQVIL